MRNVYKWNLEDVRKEEIWTILFVSRNKDNRDVENFKQRKKSFVSTKKPEDLLKEFDVFVKMKALKMSFRDFMFLLIQDLIQKHLKLYNIRC